MDLTTPVSELSRVGTTASKHLQRLGIFTVRDLLMYFPFRYEDFRQIVPVQSLVEGTMVTIRVRVEQIANRRSFKRHKNITEALVADDSESIRVVWFNQPYIAKNIQVGDTIFLSGTVKSDMLGLQFVSPSYEKVGAEEPTHTGRLVPQYPLTAGVTQKQVRFLVSQVIELAKTIPEWLPENILETYDLVPFAAALHGIHFPHDEEDLKKCTERLKFDELFLLALQAALARRELVSVRAPVLTFQEAAIKEFVSKLPFTLTKTQKISAWEILQNIGAGTPMNRLLSGDVGSGKTVVAAMSMYNATLGGYQAVLMAPTEILVEQHYQSVKKMLAPYDVPVGLITGSKVEMPGAPEGSVKKQHTAFYEALSSGSLAVAIGTHALLSEEVKFKKLGLVVVDEQHRFGVAQRKLIKEKGKGVHFLSMTATPIPRSLALMLYGDLEVSIINELPVGRKKIITRLVEPSKREKAYQFIRDQVRLGRQVFVVCPLIEVIITPEGIGASDKKSVMSEYKKLSEQIFSDLRVSYLHGKLKPIEKEAIMARFKAGEIDILVSTSVVEVGVDIPNASVMMIEGADRFGLAQLHQFRGRVGRSSHQSYCLLFTDVPSRPVLERLRYFEAHSDGFKLAEKDLELRGPGEVYGVEQSGMMQLRLATLRDIDVVKKTRAAAESVAGSIDNFPMILARVKDWQAKVHLE